jgi:hypothetical protein
LDGDVRHRCADVEGFDTGLAAATLADACSSAGHCRPALDESSRDTATRFTIRMPALRAPVALHYRLSALRDDGAIVVRQQLFCALSINEAPLANDDVYQLMPGDVLVVAPADADNLLANDRDDDDVRNAGLSVDRLVRAPGHARQFTLDQQGGFVYESPVDVLPAELDYLEDSFVYAVTDGLHTVDATVRLRISAASQSPRQLQELPDLTVLAGDDGQSGGWKSYDLAAMFNDPDSDSLRFSMDAFPLPVAGKIELTPDGVLRIRASSADSGSYLLSITISDGRTRIQANQLLQIVVQDHSSSNRTPTVTDISNRIVSGRFDYAVRGFFMDPDGGQLTFTASGLPATVTISEAGVISGQSSALNRGRWFVQVTADDGRSGTVTDGFLLIIN